MGGEEGVDSPGVAGQGQELVAGREAEPLRGLLAEVGGVLGDGLRGQLQGALF